LADLIQLQCGNRVRVAVSVRSEGREGHLFFDDGQIVHAVAGERVGEEAVFEILGWTTGTFGQSAEAWPDEPSVTGAWQHLLLTAAQKRDEAQAGFPTVSTARFVAVKKPPAPALVTSKASELVTSLPRPSRKAPQPETDQVNEGAWAAIGWLSSVHCAARLDDSGNVLESRGDAQELSGLAVYVRRLADLMGENLGQAGFRGFECRSESSWLVLFVDAPGSYIVASTTAPQELRSLYRS